MLINSSGKNPTRIFSNSEPPLYVGAPSVFPSKIVCGIDAVQACGNEHGIVGQHLSILSDLANKHDVVFGFRPVNPLATQLLAQGYPTKGLAIKGKSADWGPMAGFIPVLQKFSKLAGDPDAVHKMDMEVDVCIKKGHAISLPLKINKKRLNNLIRMGVITKTKKIGTEDIVLHTKKNNQEYIFTAKLIHHHQATEYAISYQDKPVHVLATSSQNNQQARPLTADYDLLLFAVPIAQLDDQDNYKVSPVGSKAISRKLLQYLSSHRTEGPLKVNNSLTPTTNRIVKSTPPPIMVDVTKPESDRGVISPRLNKFIPEINRALGRTGSNDIVQHGADTQNPYTVTADNYPSVIFLPERVGQFGGVAMARNKEEAIQIYKDIKDSGFQFFGNEKWAEEMPVESYRRTSFNEARDALENCPPLMK